jgi:two-component system chemotaxis response regulator CheY
MGESRPMRRTNINLGGLAFLIADSNAYSLTMIHGILRGFGVTKVTEVRDANSALQVFSEHCPDIFLCDIALPPVGGIEFIKFIRNQADLPFRTLPILAMTGDTRATEIKRARDCGANMILARPTSPAALYERLVWVAFNARKYVEAPNYSGPDRRSRHELSPGDVSRRKDDNFAADRDDSGPAMSQSEIDALLNAAR